MPSVALPGSPATPRAADVRCLAPLWWHHAPLSPQTSTEMKRDLPAGAKQTQVYARDTKVKANSYGALLKKYTASFGEMGKGLAAADAGPLDEAYVGGGS